MTPDDLGNVDKIIASVQLLVMVCLAVIWFIPDGHCKAECDCRKPKRRHK